MLSYTISPQCTAPDGSELYLSWDNEAGSVIVASKLSDDSQLWVPVLWVDANGARGIALSNVMTSQVIAAPADNKPVILVPPSQIESQRSLWNFKGSTVRYDAVQLDADTRINLNVSGDGPYESGTPVLAFKWGGGHANEVWIFTSVTS